VNAVFGPDCQKITPLSKDHAVGLEMSCPGGACYWVPEIPQRRQITALEDGERRRRSLLPTRSL
jgi:hypothetical protein